MRGIGVQPQAGFTMLLPKSRMSLEQSPASPYDVAMPPQWAVLCANFLIVVNFIVALLVPWVEAKYPISNPFFPIYVPVELGLLRCFSDVCQMNTDMPSGGPSWGPPGQQGGHSQGSGGGTKVLFELSAIFGVILLSASALLALGSCVMEYSRVQSQPTGPGILMLNLGMLASLLCLVAVLQYLFITLAGINGGHYEVGFYLTLSTGLLAGILCLGQSITNRKYVGEPEWHHILSVQGTGAGLYAPATAAYPPRPSYKPLTATTPIPPFAGGTGYGGTADPGRVAVQIPSANDPSRM